MFFKCIIFVEKGIFICLRITNIYDIFEKFDKEIDFSILMNECKGMNETIFLASPYITCHVAFNPTVLHSNIEYIPMVFSSTISRQRVLGRI